MRASERERERAEPGAFGGESSGKTEDANANDVPLPLTCACGGECDGRGLSIAYVLPRYQKLSEPLYLSLPRIFIFSVTCWWVLGCYYCMDIASTWGGLRV